MSDELSCDEVQDLIGGAAASVVGGQDLTEHHAPVMAHLRRCPRCRTSYFYLLDVLELQRETEVRLSAVGGPIDFAYDSVEEESWWRRLGSRHPEVFPLGFQISGGHVREALRAWEIGTQRSVPPEDVDEGRCSSPNGSGRTAVR